MGLITFFTGCAYTAPYRRIGEPPSASMGTVRPAVVAVTEVEHRRGRFRPFFADTKQVLAELPGQDGLLGYSFRIQVIGRMAWTLTVWRDYAALDAFVRSPAHRSAVLRSADTTQATKFLTYEAAVAELPPTWPNALRRLAEAPDQTASGSRRPRAKPDVEVSGSPKSFP
jgi:hypothetical protein